ncbi:MAG: hypothetical protein AAGJ18_04485, partial [Bacteroidota bacterium]
HDELIDDQITYIYVGPNKWKKTFVELENDLDKLLHVMKFTETATAEEQLPNELLEPAKWIEAMMKELDKRNMTIDQRIALEMALAKEGSYLAEQEERAEEVRKIKAKQAKQVKQIKELKEDTKKRVAFEREKAEKKIAEEKALTEQKLAEEKALAERKLTETAKNLLNLKTMPYEQIAQIVGLPLTKITQMTEHLKQSKK